MPRQTLIAAVIALLLSGTATAASLESLYAQQRERRAPAASAAIAPTPAPEELTGELVYEMLLGEVAMQRGQTQVAAQAYLDLARRTRDPRLARRATEIAIFARAPMIAVESAKIWAEVAPDADDAQRAVAALLISTDRADDAEPYLQRVFERARGNDDRRNGLFRQLAQLVGGAANRPAALRLVQRVAAPYSEIPEARIAVAQAALAAGDDTLALAEARAASALRPDFQEAVITESSVLQKQTPQAAVARLQAHLEKFPAASEVRLNYARALAGDKQYVAARREFQRVADENPSNVDVIFSIGLLSLELRDYPLAEQQFKRLLQLPFREPNLARLYLGQIAEDTKRHSEAADWYRQVTEGEQYLPAQIRLATALFKGGDLAAARNALQTATPDNPQQRVQLQLAESQLLRDANRPQEAYEFIERALANEPNNIELLYDFAMVAEKLDRVDVMEANLRKVIGINPKHAHAHNALGYSLAERNVRLDEARKLIEQALELTPNDYYIIDSLGWVLYRQGDLAGARRELERAFKGRPDAEIAAHLGEVIWMMGDRASAEKLWREALALTPDNDVLKKTLARFVPATANKQ